jgi:predicted ATP-dependent serine protease
LEVRFSPRWARPSCASGAAPHLDYLPFLGRSGYVVRGWTTLVAGYPKSGKTELIASWCLEQSDPILYFTEEPESVWAARLAKLPGDWSHVFLVFALGADPADILATIINSRESIIVIDTVRNLLALHDETDNSEVARVLAPHITACRTAGKTLMLLHHIRKGGGSYGEGITGGHAFLGIVDAAIEILREQNLGENCRHIRGWGRVAPIPELLYELLEDGTMKALGDPMAVHLEALQGRIAEVLNGDWQTTKEVWEALEEPRPSKSRSGWHWPRWSAAAAFGVTPSKTSVAPPIASA